MVAFNPSILENWKSSGYKYVYVMPLKKYGVLQPLKQEKEMKKGYTIEIEELSLIQMTAEYFWAKEKDAVLQHIHAH
jgi:hypothetical protein